MKLRDVPWLTEGAISFLREFIVKNPLPKVLEFGSGASTLWFDKLSSIVISIEHNQEWFNIINPLVSEKTKIIFHKANNIKNPGGQNNIWLDYTDFIDDDYSIEARKFPNDYFDIILIDGRNRVLCCQEARQKLKSKGLIVLDNSERNAYKECFNLCIDFKIFHFVQEKPDLYGSFCKGWTTTIWVKP